MARSDTFGQLLCAVLGRCQRERCVDRELYIINVPASAFTQPALALIGFALAVPLGWLLAHALRWLVLHLANIQLPVPYTLGTLGLALAGTLVLAVLVVAVPLRRATRLRPGDAIRYN